jgi:enediyne biosynthesis protein E4
MNLSGCRFAAVVIALGIIGGNGVHSQNHPGGEAPSSNVRFTDISGSAGLHFRHINGASPEKHLAETMGSGGLFFDFDNDGWIDIFLVDGGSLADPALARQARHRLFRNRGNGTFDDVTQSSGIRTLGYGMGACAGDYDNDGLVDLYITSVGPNTLYRNAGGGAFTDVTRTAGVGSPLWSTACAFADLDKDGYLDLFVVNYVSADGERNPYCGNARLNVRFYCHPLVYEPLPSVVYRNNGDGTFSDVSAESGIGALRGNGLGVVIADYDDDSWPDIFVANDSVPNFLFHRTGAWRYEDVALQTGVAVASDGRARAGMGTDAADYDGDGRLDLVVTNLDFEMFSLFRGLGGRLFTYATPESGIGAATLPFVGFGAVFFDFDNDTLLDVAFANGHMLDNPERFRAGTSHAQRNLLFRNVGAGRFRNVTATAGPGFALEKVGRGLAVGDIDNDGNLDLLVTNNGQTADLLRNEGSGHHALVIRLIGTQSNRDGIGARLRLTSAGRTQMREVKGGSSYLSQNDLRQHFGLGESTRAERLEVTWPSGRLEIVQDLPANHIISVRESSGIVDRRPFVR